MFSLQLFPSTSVVLLLGVGSSSKSCSQFSVFTFGGSLLLYKLTDKIIPLRVSEKSEYIGLDISQHDEQMDPESETSIE